MAPIKTHCAYLGILACFWKLISFLPSFHQETRQNSLQPHRSPRLLVSWRKRRLSCHIVEHDVLPWRYSKSTLSAMGISGQNPRTLSEQKGTQRIEDWRSEISEGQRGGKSSSFFPKIPVALITASPLS